MTGLEAFAAAVGHHQAGRLQEADRIYQQVLAADPNHAGAWHLRGVLASQVGQNAVAIRSIERALALQPEYVEAHNNLGLVYEKEGRLSDAVACFRRAMELKPGFAAAYGNLGNVVVRLGQGREAVAHYRRAVELEPGSAEAHFNLGVGLQMVGAAAEAAQCYRRTTDLQPSHAKANNNLGLLLMEQGQLDEAENCFRRAIEQQVNHPEVHNNLGTLLVNQRKWEGALAAFDRALEQRPEYAEAQAGRGNVFKEQGKFDEAIACYQRALRLNPDLANVHCNLGNVFHEQGQLELAADAFREALRCDSAHAVASLGLGNVLLEQRRADEAAACFRRAIELKPDYAAAYVNLAAAMRDENWPKIEAYCRKGIELRPDYAEAHLNLAIALDRQRRLDEALASCDRAIELDPKSALAYNTRGAILKDMAKLEEAIVAYRRAVELKPDLPLAHSALVYGLYFCPGLGSAAIYEDHRRWNERHAEPLAKLIQPHGNDPSPERRLRIGYVSPDFRHHCQALFTTPLFSNHDHGQFEIFCYSNVARPDDVTERLRTLADQWRDVVGLSAERVAEVIRQDRIDILVDLTMHMDKGELVLFARKPAPVQVCWLAYPGTTGLTAMDYRFTDPYLDPPGMFDRFYSEEWIRLPHTFWCYDPLTKEPGGGEKHSAVRGTSQRAFPTALGGVNRLPALEKGHVTFGCLNNFCKVNEGALRLWAGVMKAVEGSRLILMAPEGSARERVLRILGEAEIGEERVTFVPFQSRARYLATYHQIDIGLETLPYNGHTTSLDSFWMGVPVPTIVGQTVVGRAGVCLLENLGLRELIAEAPEEYVRVVSELAGDLARLGGMRAELRGRMERSPLMDGKRFARDMEAAYRMIWRRWCEGRR